MLRSHHYECRSFRFSVQTDLVEADRVVSAAFADLDVGVDGTSRPPVAVYELLDSDGGLQLRQNSVPIQRFDHVGPAIDHLVAAVNQRVLDASGETLNLHAAGVVDGRDRGVILPGVSGAGKTTLCATLVRAGLAYLTDEMIGIDPVDLTLLGYPKALTVKAGSRDLLGADLDFGPFATDGAAQARWYVPVGALGDGGVRLTAAARAVVFARRVNDAGPSLEALPRAEAVLRLLLNSFDLGRFGPGGVALLARLVSSCHCMVATYQDARTVVPLISDLLTDPVDPVAFVSLATHTPSGRPLGGRIAISSSPEPAAGVVGVAFPDGGVVYEPTAGRTLLLDPIGAAVWPMLDGETSVGDLADELACHFDSGADEIREDLLSLCLRLAESGFLAGVEATVAAPDWRTALAALDGSRQ